jgi:flagellin-like hook-associated protein FlgL
VGADYVRGDNIFYQDKHYVYVSHLPSSDESFSGDDGLNDFEQLLLNGAIKELGIHVETTGAGGSAEKAQNSFYAANQDLEFVDRLPGSGLVRTSGSARMGDPMQNGDGVFNSLDDQLYNELNPGNDGIYGTMDDFYSSTPYADVASKAGHVDSDSDNNKDLLDLSNDLSDFSVADFVDYTQTVANFRAINGGTMSRINYANRILEENKINLESARGRIMDTDISLEASKMARQNVIMQASAAMVTQANQMQQIVLQLLQ